MPGASHPYYTSIYNDDDTFYLFQKHLSSLPSTFTGGNTVPLVPTHPTPTVDVDLTCTALVYNGPCWGRWDAGTH